MAAIFSLVLSLGCITEQEAVLLVSVQTDVPDTTSADQISIEGYLQRSPERQFIITWVTVNGGLLTAVDTANTFMQFSVTVPLNADSENNLELSAADETGASTISPWRKTVVHVTDPPQ